MPTRSASPRPALGNRPGFALIAALWLLIALGAVGLEVSLQSRTRRRAAANLVDEVRARAIADGATEYARSRLTSAMIGRAEQLRNEAAQSATTTAARDRARRMDNQTLFRQSDPGLDPWREPAELVPTSLSVDSITAQLDVRDTGAALNPNQADETMLRQFLALGLRIDYTVADRLTQAILDWRDDDDLPRVNGAEREEYLAAGAAVLPANRQFNELKDLRYVLGMTPEIFEQMQPYLTLVSSGRINVNSAPEPVLLALPGFNQAAATTVLRMRQSGRLPRNEGELRAFLPPGASASIQQFQREFTRRSAYSTDEVEINANVDLPGSPVTVRALVVVARGATGASVVWRRID
jgi:type II secretory pathway component PulK